MVFVSLMILLRSYTCNPFPYFEWQTAGGMARKDCLCYGYKKMGRCNSPMCRNMLDEGCGMSRAQARFQACELCDTALHSSVCERGCKDSHLDQSCLAHQLKETGCLFQLLAP